MTSLFTTAEEDLKALFESLNVGDIQDKVDAATYFKGNQYYEWELVGDAQYSYDKSRLIASVAGSQDYTINLALQQGNLMANCNCPVEGICKHITAVLIFAVQKGNAIEVGENRVEGSPIHQHLLGLSKEELASLLLKYAPDELFVLIHNLHASPAEAIEAYSRAEAAIRKLFSNTELLYSPLDFHEALEKQLSRLLGLEHQLQDRLGGLIFYIIREIENTFDRGYLYDEDDDTGFELPEAFNTLVAQYISVLPYDAKTRFLKQLDETLSESLYPTFESLAGLSHESFTQEELPAVKTMLLQEHKNISAPLAEEYYELVRPLLSETEKETILNHLKEEDSRWLLELADLYRTRGREAEALEIIKTSLATPAAAEDVEPIYLLYLELLSASGNVPEAVCMEAIERCASSRLLEKITQICQANHHDYERMLEQKNPQALVEYLENNGRLEEALSLLKRNDSIWDHYRYVFFKNHAKEFPDDAVQYFSGLIDKNLQYTGNPHYYAIVEALKQIKKVDEQLAAAIIADLRTNYKRRITLMNLLSEV